MEHVVFHTGPDGAPEFRRFSSLDEAVRYVEHVRNAEGVVDVSVHMLTPVPLAFRAYYRVEVPVADGAGALVPDQTAPDVMVAVAPAEPAPTVLPVQPVEAVEFTSEVAPVADAEAGAPQAGGKRSLGFFAH